MTDFKPFEADLTELRKVHSLLHGALDALFRDANPTEAGRLLIIVDDRLTALINTALHADDVAITADKSSENAVKSRIAGSVRPEPPLPPPPKAELRDRAVVESVPERAGPSAGEVAQVGLPKAVSPAASRADSEPVPAAKDDPAAPVAGSYFAFPPLPSFDEIVNASTAARTKVADWSEPAAESHGPIALPATLPAPASTPPAVAKPEPESPVAAPQVTDTIPTTELAAVATKTAPAEEETASPSDGPGDEEEADVVAESAGSKEGRKAMDLPFAGMATRLVGNLRGALFNLTRQKGESASASLAAAEAGIADDLAERDVTTAEEEIADDVFDDLADHEAALSFEEQVALLHSFADELIAGGLLEPAMQETGGRIVVRNVDDGLDVAVKGLPTPLGTVRLSEDGLTVIYHPRLGMEQADRPPNRADIATWLDAMAEVVVSVMADIAARRRKGPGGP